MLHKRACTEAHMKDYSPQHTKTQTHQFRKTRLIGGLTLYQGFRIVERNETFRTHGHVRIRELHECFATFNPQEAQQHWEDITCGTSS